MGGQGTATADSLRNIAMLGVPSLSVQKSGGIHGGGTMSTPSGVSIEVEASAVTASSDATDQ